MTEENEKRREEFIAAAEKLFKENGIVNTTVNAIVREVDVAKGLFYYYFKSKDDVIEAISTRYAAVFRTRLQKVLEGDSYEERLEGFIDSVVFSFRELWANLRGENENIDLSLLSNRTIDETRLIAAGLLQELLEEGVEKGILDVPNPRYAAEMLAGGIAAMVGREDADMKEVRRIVLDFIDRCRRNTYEQP